MLTRRRLVRRSLGLLAGASVAGLTAVGFGTTWLWATPEITRLSVGIASLPSAFIGLRLVHLTDLHFGPRVPTSVIERAVDIANTLRGDAVVITGDFISRAEPADLAALADTLRRLDAPLGVYGVLGNHDYWTNACAVRGALAQAGVRLLDNASVEWRRGDSALYLAGVDDHWEGHADLIRALAAMPATGIAILLAHEPDFADVAAGDARVRLQLSGHSHGGQVRDLAGQPLELPAFAHRYPLGRNEVGDLTVYASRGVGVTGPPIRLNCPPEVTLIDLVAR